MEEKIEKSLGGRKSGQPFGRQKGMVARVGEKN